jgi:phage terminase large subunit-like protein
MASVEVGRQELYVEMQGLDKLWSLHSKLEIPLAHVAGARVDPDEARQASGTGIKAGGARVGDHLVAGTFRQEGAYVFWDVHDLDRSVIIDLHDERYARLVLEVDDPAAVAAEINRAVGG